MWSVPGHNVEFQHTRGDSGVFGSVVGVESGREDSIKKNRPELVTFTTKTGEQVFAEHHVPPIIDFLSLDVEGSELQVLQGINHAAHCFRNVAIESNLVEPMRSEMRAFLEARGYAYAGSEEFDDYYQNACSPTAKR